MLNLILPVTITIAGGLYVLSYLEEMRRSVRLVCLLTPVNENEEETLLLVDIVATKRKSEFHYSPKFLFKKTFYSLELTKSAYLPDVLENAEDERNYEIFQGEQTQYYGAMTVDKSFASLIGRGLALRNLDDNKIVAFGVVGYAS